MLSPGEWHLQVPRERNANLRWRLTILRKAQADPNVRGLLCQSCNHMIGHSKDRPETLIAGAEYLRRHQC